MPFCNNPDCPHKKNTGSSAEYRDGTTHCAECGSLLTDIHADPFFKTGKADTDLTKKIFITIGLLLFLQLLNLIPLPGVDISGFTDNLITYYFKSSNISICALGIMPYISACILVEMLSLVIPSLKKWRGEKHEGRRKLNITARWFTLLLCLIQGIGLSVSLSNMAAPDGSMVAAGTGPGFKFMIIATLTACVFLNLWIADLITSKGIGNGISMLIFADIVIYICSLLFTRLSNSYGYSNFMGYAVAIFLILSGAGAFILFMEKGEYNIKARLKNNSPINLPFKYNTSGIIPASFAASFAMIPTTANYFYTETDYPAFLEYFQYGAWGYYVTFSIITIVLYFLFASLYYNPDKILSFLKSKNAEPVLNEGISFEKLLDSKITILTLVGVLYLLVYSIFIHPEIHASVLISGLVLIRFVSIILDLAEDVKARKKYGYFVKINEMQKPYEAKFIKYLLEQNSIPCFLEGYYHRSLYYFFGPFIEISVYVQKDKEAEAIKIISGS